MKAALTMPPSPSDFIVSQFRRSLFQSSFFLFGTLVSMSTINILFLSGSFHHGASSFTSCTFPDASVYEGLSIGCRIDSYSLKKESLIVGFPNTGRSLLQTLLVASFADSLIFSTTLEPLSWSPAVVEIMRMHIIKKAPLIIATLLRDTIGPSMTAKASKTAGNERLKLDAGELPDTWLCQRRGANPIN
jgi:hypothetical protein